MDEGKMSIMERSVSDFIKLPYEKKILVLGIMQGMIISQPDRNEQTGQQLKPSPEQAAR